MITLPVLNCDNCGACCTTQGTPPFVRIEADFPPPELAWDVVEHQWRYDDGLPCLWFNVETKRCKHYEHRPQSCRTAVVPGDEYCLKFRSEQAVS